MIQQTYSVSVSIGIVIIIICAVDTGAVAAKPSVTGTFDVYDYGALGDGLTLDTKAIQAAIDACTHAGGGKVYLHNGRFLSGTIVLKNNVTLYLEADAVLLGSTNLEDYPVTIPAYRSYTDNYTDKSLIYAEKAENISLLGRGVIDGQGASFEGPYKVRPYIMRIVQCNNVRTKDVTIQNSPMWVQHYLACDNVLIDGISVHSKVNKNNDGINIDSCQKVRIANCEIYSGDDAIVLKSTSGRVCRNVTVTNCVINSDCNGLKLGTESNGGFENITINNCMIYDTRLASIALEMVDGGVFNRVTVSNIIMDNVKGGIFVRLGNRARPYQAAGTSHGSFDVENGVKQPGMGSMRNIMISNVQASGVGSIGCSITGLPGFPVENITLQNIRITFAGGGTLEHASRDIPENAENYPEHSMFGTLPAYGFYVRHAKNVKFRHMDLGFEQDDHRPALVFDDVTDLEILGFQAESTPLAQALIWLKQVDGAFIHGCAPRETHPTFVRLNGEKSKNVTLMNNDMSAVRQVVDQGQEVSKNALNLGNNQP